ncbi:MAG TPA: hypothetical protein VIR34_08875 [Gemmatimonadaceae bacterium]
MIQSDDDGVAIGADLGIQAALAKRRRNVGGAINSMRVELLQER